MGYCVRNVCSIQSEDTYRANSHASRLMKYGVCRGTKPLYRESYKRSDVKIACVLITHLPMKAELRRRPELSGRPAIITEGPGSKQVVLDRSREATGVTAGMPLQEALSRCKGATLLQADEPYYQVVFDRVVASLEHRSPLVEKGELGCAYVGLDGLQAMYRSEARLVASLLHAAPHDLNPRLGLASGKFPAYVAALESPGGQATRVSDDEAAEFLRGLPVDLPPLSWDKKVSLHRFGLHVLGQLASLPVGPVQAQFGPEGRTAWELANGIDSSPLAPYKRQEAVSEFLTFPSPTTTQHNLLVAIEMLLGRAFANPTLRGRYVRTATMEGSVLQRPPWARRFVFKEAVNSKERALFALKGLVERVVLPGPLEDMRLTLLGFTGESGIQAGLFSDIRRQEQLREMVRQLEARLGGKPPIYQVRDIEPWSRIPERRQALVQFDP